MPSTSITAFLDEPYPEHLTLREARGIYFARNGLGDGGYDKKWVHIELPWFTYAMPNPEARKVAVPFHDVNHVLTGYLASPAGECVVAGYEVGSGIGPYWMGWLISSQAMVLGLPILPRAVFHAFVRGRRARSTYLQPLDDLLPLSLGDVRRRMGVLPEDGVPAATAGDLFAFFLHVLVTLLAHALLVGLLIAPVYALL